MAVRGQYIPHELLVKALTKHRGLVSAAAEDIGMNATHLYTRIAKSPPLKDLVTQLRDRQLDRAERKLFEQIDNGEAWAICFYLKTQGRARGYIEHHGVDVTSGGQPLDLAALVLAVAGEQQEPAQLVEARIVDAG